MGIFSKISDSLFGSGGLVSQYWRLSGGLVDGVLGTNFVGDYDAQKNYDLQKAQLQYQKDLQQTIFNREDMAVQRRAADLKAAGINPLLAAGAAAQSGAVVRTETPQRMTAEYNPLNKIAALLNLSKTAAESDVLSKTAANMEVQNANLQAQNYLLAAQTYKTYIDAGYTRVQAAQKVSDLFGNKETGFNVLGFKFNDKRPNVTPEQIESLLMTMPDLNGRLPQ